MKSKIFAFTLMCGALISPWVALDAVWEPYTTLSDPAFSYEESQALAVNFQGNAIVVWATENSPYGPGESGIASSFYTRGIGWAPFEWVSSFALTPNGGPLYRGQADADVDMNSSNYAVAVWEGRIIVDNIPLPILSSRRQPDGSFGPIDIISNPDGDVNAYNASVQVNEAGTALAVWRQTQFSGANQFTMISFLPYGGTWSAPLAVSAAELGQNTEVYARSALNSRGDAVVAWRGSLAVDAIMQLNVVTYNAATDTWSAPVILDSGNGFNRFDNPVVSIDESGNAVIIWVDSLTSELKTSYYLFGGVWEPITILSNNGVSQSSYVIMDPAGNSTAVWSDSSEMIYSASRPVGGVWSLPVIISQGTDNNMYTFQILDPVAVDLYGNIMAIWLTDDGGMSAFKPFGQAWQAPELVSEQMGLVNVGLAECGFAVASWVGGPNGDAEIRAAIHDDLLPFIVAGSARYTQCTLKFATQKRVISQLTWDSLYPDCVAAFNIYCNGELIGTSTDGSLAFTVADCDGSCHFTLTAVTLEGVESAPIPFVLRS